MEFLRGVRGKVFAADAQVEEKPTLLYGVFLTPSKVAATGILRCYDGFRTGGELKAEFHVSYDFGATTTFPIQFMHGLYIALVGDLTTATIMWLSNEAAIALFHQELELKKWHQESKVHTIEEALRQVGL